MVYHFLESLQIALKEMQSFVKYIWLRVTLREVLLSREEIESSRLYFLLEVR